MPPGKLAPSNAVQGNMKLVGHLLRPLRRLLPRLLGCVLAVSVVQAAEVDSYTHRGADLPDITDLLNGEVRQRITAAVQEANVRLDQKRALARKLGLTPEHGCDPGPLYQALGKRLSGFVFGRIEKFIDALPTELRAANRKEASIYRDFRFTDAPSLTARDWLASLVRVNSQYVGADKFGHFFSEGWQFYRYHYQDHDSLDATLLRGALMETSYYGRLATAVYSYADLVANFQGMRFWNAVLGEQPDVLTGRRPAPLVVCRGGHFRLVRTFDWRDYVDAAWDEAVNCDDFADAGLLQRVRARLPHNGAPLGCFTGGNDLSALRRKYGPWAPALLNERSGVVQRGVLDVIERLLVANRGGHRRMD